MTLSINVGTTVAISAFTPYVRPRTTACPDDERERRTREAIRDFCRASFVLRQRDAALCTTVAGQRVYAAGMPAGLELVAIHSAWANGQEIDCEVPGEDEVAPGCSASDWVVGVEADDAIRLSPAPDCAGIAVTGTVSWSPSDTATAPIPADLYNRWRNAIVARAVWILCMQPGKLWTNVGLAQDQDGIYRQQLTLASTRTGPVRRRPLRTQVQDAQQCGLQRTRGCR